MEVETESIREQNVAMERIKYFLNECLENSIFVQDTELKIIEKYNTCGFKVCTVPEEPYDQIITLLLLTKLNSITEGRLVITDVTLGSRMSDEVRFICDIESPLGPLEAHGWWMDSGTSISSPKKSLKKDKIVKLIKTPSTDWAESNLIWKEKDVLSKSEIFFTTEQEK
jgi:phage gp46-like protein